MTGLGRCPNCVQSSLKSITRGAGVGWSVAGLSAVGLPGKAGAVAAAVGAISGGSSLMPAGAAGAVSSDATLPDGVSGVAVSLAMAAAPGLTQRVPSTAGPMGPLLLRLPVRPGPSLSSAGSRGTAGSLGVAIPGWGESRPVVAGDGPAGGWTGVTWARAGAGVVRS